MRSWLAGSRPMKLFYLSFFAGTGLYLPYLSLYLQAIHFTGAQIGLIASLTPLAGVLLPPLWGVLSDRRGWRKQLLAASLMLAAISAWVAWLAGTFLVLLPLLLLLAVCLSPTVPLADATTLEWLRRHDGTYGAIRVFGSLGYLISSLVMGQVFEGRHIFWLYPFYGGALAVTFLVSLSLPRQGDLVRLDRGEGVVSLLHDRVVVLFLLCTLVGYGTFAAYNTFFALYLKGLGATTGIVGLAAGLATLSEIPAMAFSGRLLAKFGFKPLLLVALGVAVLRWLGYSQVHDYRLALLFQPLHGLTFALFYVAGVTFMERRVPPRLRATGQSLFNGATFGLGTVLASNLFGLLYDHIHASGIFLLAAAIAAASVLTLALVVPGEPAAPSTE